VYLSNCIILVIIHTANSGFRYTDYASILYSAQDNETYINVKVNVSSFILLINLQCYYQDGRFVEGRKELFMLICGNVV